MKTLLVIAALTLLGAAFVVSADNTRRTSEHSCMVTTGTPDCNGVNWRDVLEAL